MIKFWIEAIKLAKGNFAYKEMFRWESEATIKKETGEVVPERVVQSYVDDTTRANFKTEYDAWFNEVEPKRAEVHAAALAKYYETHGEKKV